MTDANPSGALHGADKLDIAIQPFPDGNFSKLKLDGVDDALLLITQTNGEPFRKDSELKVRVLRPPSDQRSTRASANDLHRLPPAGQLARTTTLRHRALDPPEQHRRDRKKRMPCRVSGSEMRIEIACGPRAHTTRHANPGHVHPRPTGSLANTTRHPRPRSSGDRASVS